MKISREWLLEFVDFTDLSTSEFSELITTRVAEVDATFAIGAPLAQAIAGEILEVSIHPSKPKLSLVKVGDGKKVFSVVSSAPDLAIGTLVAFVPPGGKIKKTDKNASDEILEEILIDVVEREVAGEISQGALVTEAELGLSSHHETVFHLDGLGFKAGIF